MQGNPIKITPEYVLDLISRRRWAILLPLCVVLIGGIYYAATATKIFEAKTLILVEGQSVPQSFVQSIVTEDTSERINTISQQILSRTNLEKIVQELSLFAGSQYDGMYMEDKVARIRKDISVHVITDRSRNTDAFEISHKGKDPEKVMRVVNGLAASFINENIKVRESLAVGTSTFLEAELENMRLRLEQVEAKIQDYRKKHMGELPEQLETNLRILERFQEDLSDRQQNSRDAKSRLAVLQKQATSNQPSVVVIGGNQNTQSQTGVVSIADLINKLETLQSRYTDKHPDIIRLKKQIAEMKSRGESSEGSKAKFEASSIPPLLRAQIADVQREIHLTEVEIENLKNQIATYQRHIENTPKREQEILSLKRDYENIRTSYASLLDRKFSADIAVNMERKQKGEQFRIVDPAKLPERPVEPDMRRIFFMVTAAGLGIGCGLAFLLDFLDGSFRIPEDIENYFELPVLVTIPKLIDHKQKIITRLNTIGSLSFAVFNFCLIGLFGLISLKNIDISRYF